MVPRTLAVVGCLNREAPYFQGARGKGIAVLSFDEQSGRLALLGETAGIDNPSFLSIHPSNGCLYANSEVLGWNEGTVSAYRLNPTTGALIYLNKQATLGSIAAHNSFDRSGRFLLLANYGIGPADEQPGQSVVVFPIRPDGALAPPVASQKHRGSGPDPARQERAHAHCVLASPDNRFVLASDLGIDKLLCYRLDGESGRLAPAGVLALPPGAGPRHFAFHPGGRFVYVIDELDSTVAAATFDEAAGKLNLLHALPALPPDFAGESHCADLQVAADGRFVYASNRGHDSIAIYAVDIGSGRLSLVGHQPTLGRTPRNFAIDPSGRFLLVANQNSDEIVVFSIDVQSGRLGDTGQRAAVGTPMCIKLARF